MDEIWVFVKDINKRLWDDGYTQAYCWVTAVGTLWGS